MSELKVLLTPELEQFITGTFNKDVTAEGDVRCYGRFEYTRKASDPEHQYMATHIDANLLPSRFQIGDSVIVTIGDSTKIQDCRVTKVHFAVSKVLYDVQIEYYSGQGPDNSGRTNALFGSTRLYNIDSCFVEPAE